LDVSGDIVLDPSNLSISNEQVQALLDEIDSAKKTQESEGPYVRPDVLRFVAEDSKVERTANIKKREAEQRDREAARMLNEEEQRRFSRHKKPGGNPTISSSDDDGDDDFVDKAEQKRKKNQQFGGGGGGGGGGGKPSIAAALFDGFMYKKPDLENDAWKDEKPPALDTQDGPDSDFGVDLEEDADGAGDGAGAGGGRKVGKVEIIPESGDVNIMKDEEPVAIQIGRMYISAAGGGHGADDSEAAKAVAAAAAVTAPSPLQAHFSIYDGESDGDQLEFHDAEEDLKKVEISYEDGLLDPSFADMLGDGDVNGNGGGGVAGTTIATAALKPQHHQNQPKTLPKNPRRSKKGQQEAKAELEAATKTAELLISANQPPPDLHNATRCTITRECTTGKRSVVKSASLTLAYSSGVPDFEVQLIEKEAFSRIHHWYLLWGKDLPRNCEHVLPEKNEHASVKSAERMKLLLNLQGPSAGAGGDGAAGGAGGKGAASLATTEEMTAQDHGGDAGEVHLEETSPLKMEAKAKQPPGGGGGGGGARGAGGSDRHTRGVQHNYALPDDEDIIEIDDDDDTRSPPGKKQQRGPSTAAAAPTGKRKNNNTANAAGAAADGNGKSNKTGPIYVGEYDFVGSQEQQPHQQQKKQKKQQQQQRISLNKGGAGVGNKSPPVSPRSKIPKGARTEGGRKFASTASTLLTNLRNVGGNNGGGGGGKNKQRRGGGGGGGGKGGHQRKAEAAVDLTRDEDGHETSDSL
jgi:hypothetical protein